MGRLLPRCAAWFLAIVFIFAVGSGERAAAASLTAGPARVALIEGGPYPDFVGILAALAQGLEERNVITRGSVPASATSTQEIWQWLADNAGGTTMSFVADAFYTADWDSTQLEEKKNALIRRIQTEKDIDIVIVLGTKAGQSIVPEDIDTPLVILAASDAVTMGLVDSVEDSGKDNVFAVVEENRYYRELLLFHDIFKFSRLGVAYEDSPVGRGTIAYAQIAKAARDAKFELVTCTGSFLGDVAFATENTIACHREFAQKKVDAVYMTISNGLVAERMNDILSPLHKASLPTFSQKGMTEVKYGALLSVSQESFRGQGLFAARAVANILGGQSPRAQKQAHEEPMSLALNLYTAMLIGWTPPLAVLAAVDVIFER